MQHNVLPPITWRSNVRAIGAIARKDWIVFLRYPLNALFRIVEPIMWLTPIYFLGLSFASGGRNVGFAGYSGTGDYMSFVLIGAVLSSYVSAVFWGMGYALKEEMDAGVLESNWLTPSSRVLLLAGRTVASLAITTVNSAVMLLLAWIVFGFHVSGNVFVAALALVPMLIALYGFGFAFAAIVLLLKDANTLIDVSNFVVSQLSGSQFPIQVLPRFLLPLSLALPLTYGYDLVRGYLLNTQTILPVRYEIAILLVFMLVMAGLGYAVFRLVERRCRSLGTIGTH